ncbi:MAG: GNAT family N-acetyltransferase [Cellulosilyticaceae bacterium]
MLHGMEIKIREENKKDFETIYEVVKEAFATAEHSDGTEQDLVVRLRKGDGYVKELALVAVIDETVIGHVMFTKAQIVEGDKVHETLALAPLAVAEVFQKMGVGTQLVEEGLRRAKELGHKRVIVLGSDAYYPRFGFEEAANFGIKAPFEVPSPCFMAVALTEGGLEKVAGTVVYDKAFGV